MPVSDHFSSTPQKIIRMRKLVGRFDSLSWFAIWTKHRTKSVKELIESSDSHKTLLKEASALFADPHGADFIIGSFPIIFPVLTNLFPKTTKNAASAEVNIDFFTLYRYSNFSGEGAMSPYPAKLISFVIVHTWEMWIQVFECISENFLSFVSEVWEINPPSSKKSPLWCRSFLNELYEFLFGKGSQCSEY